jgi:hypothetical protein
MHSGIYFTLNGFRRGRYLSLRFLPTLFVRDQGIHESVLRFPFPSSTPALSLSLAFSLSRPPFPQREFARAQKIKNRFRFQLSLSYCHHHPVSLVPPTNFPTASSALAHHLSWERQLTPPTSILQPRLLIHILSQPVRPS